MIFMILYFLNHDFHFELENITRMFFQDINLKTEYSYKGTPDTDFIITELSESDGFILLAVSCDIKGKTICIETKLSADNNKNEVELNFAKLLFEALQSITGYTPPWGILTGVRPSKLMTSLINESGEADAEKYFKKQLFVSDKKIKLVSDVCRIESEIIKKVSDNSFSLYISIPFCPTKCSYCSFVSHSITSDNARKLIPDYVQKLCEEIKISGEIAERLGLRLETVYWGGGTPTILSAGDIDLICRTISNSFIFSFVSEYTVEAGRPDTITEEKLHILKQNNITRISINPQSFSDDVLRAIGRIHSVSDTFDAFDLARKTGFNNINTDLIAGLPNDSIEGFRHSLDTAVSLSPENITVHSLARKRASVITQSNDYIPDASQAVAMLDFTQNTLTENGYIPYYMYRQSRSAGNLENVGWCKPQYECKYNIYMMEECHTVFAVGAGAVTKLKNPYSTYIERVYNYKFPYEYISRFNEIIERKNRFSEFYDEINAYKNKNSI